MEGKAVLFKVCQYRCVRYRDQGDGRRQTGGDHRLAGAHFGAINLEDIKARSALWWKQQLRERLNIPVFHDDQHGTAIVAAAAVYNGLQVVNKKIEDVKVVVSAPEQPVLPVWICWSPWGCARRTLT